MAPYDVRQGHFVGAGVNTVTRSGANQFRGSGYYWWRDNGLVGTEAKGLAYNPGTFDYHRYGAWLSGPILKDKLFFFGSYENDKFTQPGTTFRANQGGETVGGNVTRVLASDLDALSSYLKSNFGYDTGAYQDYPFETPAKRYLGKLDYNLNNRNKISLRYLQLDSHDPGPALDLELARRRQPPQQHDGPQLRELQLRDPREHQVGRRRVELDHRHQQGQQPDRRLHQERREPAAERRALPVRGHPRGGHDLHLVRLRALHARERAALPHLPGAGQLHLEQVAGTRSPSAGRVESYHSDNVFFPGSQSVYVYNSLADFYTDANDYLANQNRVTSPVTLSIFQVRWNNIPGQTKPLQPLDVWYGGLYAQDEWRPRPATSRVTYGLRVDVSSFGDTGFDNAAADELTFRDEDGSAVQYNTGKLPDAKLLWSPRVGFNWDVNGNRTTQVRGGTGLFTGPPLYVWISNQVGNTGVLTGFEDVRNTKLRPFNPNPDAYKPTNVTGAPASSYELALTEPDFKFPQVWRSNIAVDQQLPWDLIGTAEFIYSKDVNGISYINANLPAAQTNFTGADTRPRWTNNKINANVADNVVLGNQNEATPGTPRPRSRSASGRAC